MTTHLRLRFGFLMFIVLSTLACALRFRYG